MGPRIEIGSDGKLWPLMVVVSFALLMDYFIYGVVSTVADYSSGAHFGPLHGGYIVGVLAAAPLFGYLGARIGLKRSMICGVVFSAAAIALFGLAPSLPSLFTAQVLQGAASATTWTAGLSLVARHHPVARRIEMMGYALIGSAAGSVLGDVAGRMLRQIDGDQLPFLVTGALVVIDASLRFFVLPGDRRDGQSFAGVSSLLLDRSVLVSAVAVGLAAVGWSIVETFLPARLDRAGVAPALIGLIFIAASIVYGFCAPVVEGVSKRVRVGAIIAGGTLAMAIGLLLLDIAHGIIANGAAVCFLSVCYAFMLDPTTAEFGNAVDRRGLTCYSAVYAIFNIAYAIGMLAVDVTSSTLTTRPDSPPVLLFFSIVLIFGALLLWRVSEPSSASPSA